MSGYDRELAEARQAAAIGRAFDRSGHPDKAIFRPGARVLLDGTYPVIVVDAFPEGSSSYAFPHYKVRSGQEIVAVAMHRIGVAP